MPRFFNDNAVVVDPYQVAQIAVFVRTPRVWSYKPVEIDVDGKPVGKVGWRRKSPFEIDVSPGRHTLAARTGVLGSAPAEVHLAGGQRQVFEVRWSREIGISAARETNLILKEISTEPGRRAGGAFPD